LVSGRRFQTRYTGCVPAWQLPEIGFGSARCITAVDSRMNDGFDAPTAAHSCGLAE
jgi:hypothetical protein